MVRITLKYVKRVGAYYYFRKAGQYTRLPDLNDPQFSLRYQELMMDRAKADAPERGAISALVAEFRGSSDYRGNRIKQTTRANYDRYLGLLDAEYGSRPYTTMTRRIVCQMRDKMQDKPGKANNFLAVLRMLLEFAKGRGLIEVNPAAGVSYLKIGEHQPWPQSLVERALDAASPMTRLAIITGLCTGQRIGDCLAMLHRDIASGMLTITQGKTGKTVYVPVHPDWRVAIDALPKRAVTILYDRSGKPFKSTDTVQARLRDLMELLGVEGFTFHGLRKNATNRLAELGLSPHEIGVVTGMSLEMVQHYTKGAASRAIADRIAGRVNAGNVVKLKKAT
jgi:integrase